MTRTAIAATSFLACLLVAFGHAASAQVAMNCADPFTQAEINMCAGADQEAAEGEMAAAYDLLLAQLQDQDRSYAVNGPEFVGAEALLRESQEAWTTSSRAFCSIPSLTFRGGSMRPAAVASCMASLARSRAEELRWLIE
jgi:uncharacterized protein YecT (DUF1311 family)